MNTLVMLMALTAPTADQVPVIQAQPAPGPAYTVVEHPGLLQRFREKHPGIRARLRARFSRNEGPGVVPSSSMPVSPGGFVSGTVKEPPLAPMPLVAPSTVSGSTAAYAYRP